MATLNVRDFGAGRSAGADDGAIQGAFNAANNGDKIFFPENVFNNNCYLIDSVLTLNKSVCLEAESSTVALKKTNNNSNLLEVTLSGTGNHVEINKLGMISGANQLVIQITGSVTRVSNIQNSLFGGAATSSISIFCNGVNSNLNLKLYNLGFSSGSTAVVLSATSNFHNVNLTECEFKDFSIAGFRFDKIASSISSGNLAFAQNVFVDCPQGIILGSVTGTFLGNSFANTPSKVVLSGSAFAASGTLIGL